MENTEQFIKNVLEEVTGETIVDNGILLFEEELLDSMSILFLVSEIEEKYGIQVPMEEVIESNFKNIESIVKYVNRKVKRDSRG